MIFKKTFFILVFMAIASCEYQPILSKKDNYKISIDKIISNGDKGINRKIISFLSIEKEQKKNYQYDLNLISNKNIEIVAKDKAGNTTIFKITINVNLSLTDPNNQNKVYKNKNFIKSFTYNNMKNKFDLSQYVKSIESNLIDGIGMDISIFLSS